MNRVMLIGNLGKDPEVRRLSSGEAVVSFNLATTDRWRDKTTGERKERTEWHKIVVWNENIGKIAEQFCRKGSKIFIEGELQTRKWQDQDGRDRYSTEVVVQKFKGALELLGDAGGGDAEGRPREQRSSAPRSRPEAAPINDDIPF